MSPLRRAALAGAGLVAGPLAVAGLFRLVGGGWVVVPLLAAGAGTAALGRGALRWVAAGFTAGVLGTLVFFAWALSRLDSGV